MDLLWNIFTVLIVQASGPIITGVLVYFVVKRAAWEIVSSLQAVIAKLEWEKKDLTAHNSQLIGMVSEMQKQRDAARSELPVVLRQRDEAWKVLYNIEGSVRYLCDHLNLSVVDEYEGDGTRPTMFCRSHLKPVSDCEE